ncbi:MAG TPA: N-acetylmuramoyl-L-alanine amidase [Methylomirabilota bacterium]|nr:N-acetylmuramoyl-L-alanine amidase [Methylomirabilota bacterium]
MRWVVVIAGVLAFALVTPSPALAAPPPYYPPIEYVPAARANYDVGRSAAITAIVIHETDGTWLSATNWFKNPRARVSSHYLVRAWDGGIMQFVAEGDTAYHARAANPWSIGIEHEYDPRHAIPHTIAQYKSSALLVCAIAQRYGIPTDRAHIIGHNEVPGTDHSDPGPTWNWSYYMSLVNACSWQRAQPVARAALRTVENHGYVPVAGLRFDNVSDEALLLQWDLAYLGFMDVDEVASGGSRFGPLTEEAVTAFQLSQVLPLTGSYDDLTVGAMVRALLAVPAELPVNELTMDAESDEVARLQTVLGELGYMDTVTGYYGEMTMDAVTRFQKDNGIYATGSYGAITRMALAARARPTVAGASAGEEFAMERVGLVALRILPY